MDVRRHISRRRSVSCCWSAGAEIKTFFLLLDGSGKRKESEQGGSDRGAGGTLPAWHTGLTFLESLSLAHLCQRAFVEALAETTRSITWAASWQFTIAFLLEWRRLRQGGLGAEGNGNKTDDFSRSVQAWVRILVRARQSGKMKTDRQEVHVCLDDKVFCMKEVERGVGGKMAGTLGI